MVSMLLEFAFANHRSYRYWAEFSMMASKKQTVRKDTLIPLYKHQYLRAAVIIGPNGSGKSNLVDAFTFVRDFVLGSNRLGPGERIPHVPHSLARSGDASGYEIKIEENEVQYVYRFIIQGNAVAEEELYCYPKNRRTVVFSRAGHTITEGKGFTGVFSRCGAMLQENQLLLSYAGSLWTNPYGEAVYRFFTDELILLTAQNQDRLLREYLVRIAAEERLREGARDLLNGLDTGIQDIQVRQTPDAGISSARAFYDDAYSTDLFMEETFGVRKLVTLACMLADAVQNGRVLLIDDLDAGLFETVATSMVFGFLRCIPDKRAQLIFTARSTALLGMDRWGKDQLWRKDQIWFTEMDRKEHTSCLRSLLECKKIQETDNFAEQYRMGACSLLPGYAFSEMLDSIWYQEENDWDWV